MYCAVDDLRTAQPDLRLIETTDDAHPNADGSFGVAIAEDMIDLSCGVIDGYIGSRLTLPLPVVPRVLTKIAVDLTLHALYERIGATGPGTPMEKRRDNAIALLRDIGSGKVSLGLSAIESEAIDPPPGRAQVSAGMAQFTMESMTSMDTMNSLGGNW